MTLKKLISAFFLLFIFSVGFSQSHFRAVPTAENSILIEGTSNIHDWEIVVGDFSSEIDFHMNQNRLERINSIKLSIPVKSFDSGKDKMNKNTFKALDADEHKLVSFTSNAPSELVKSSAGVYKTLVKGKLSISGTTKMIEIPLELHKTKTGYTLKAKQDLIMSDYGVEPPTALFGTITTGDAVNIVFNLTHYKS